MTDKNTFEDCSIDEFIEDTVFAEIDTLGVPGLARLIRILICKGENAHAIFSAFGDRKLNIEAWRLFVNHYALATLDHVDLGEGKAILYKQPIPRGTNSSENRYYYATDLMPLIFNLLKAFLEGLRSVDTNEEV